MYNRQRLHNTFWWKIAPGGVTLGITVLIVILFCKLTGWIGSWAFWGFPFLGWLQTATVGEVVVLFGGMLFVIRALTTSSVTVKKEG